jgi:hypothetical protein
MTQRSLHVAQILWPAFLAAAVLEMVVFSWVDPSMLRVGDWQPDPMTTYSLSFLVFWGLVAVSAGVSYWLMGPQEPAQPAQGTPAGHAASQQWSHNH